MTLVAGYRVLALKPAVKQLFALIHGRNVFLFPAWQVEQLTLPSELKRASWNNRSPRLILAGDWGLSAGIGAGGRPSGAPFTAGIPAAVINTHNAMFRQLPRLVIIVTSFFPVTFETRG